MWFDTCVYHQKGVETLVEVMGADNVIFASEMIGAVRGIDDRTGRYFDDTKPYVDALNLSEADRTKIFEGNAYEAYPRLAQRLGR
jgi:4-oxalmesaconate hydratase